LGKLEDLDEYLNGWENPVHDMLKKLKKNEEPDDVYFYKKILYPPKRKLRILQKTKYDDGNEDYIFYTPRYQPKVTPPPPT